MNADFSISNDLSNAAQAIRAMADAPAADQRAQFEAIAEMLDIAARRVRRLEAASRRALAPKIGTGRFRLRCRRTASC